MTPDVESCSVIMVGRERFSSTAHCLETLLRYTPGGHEFILVLGGVPRTAEDALRRRFEGRVKLHFEPRFLNPAESRNIGLKLARNRLSAILDNDVAVTPNWLGPLVRCQKETGAAMVVPIILEDAKNIHTAGNRLFVSRKDGKAYGRKILLFHHAFVYDGTNLKREPVDYGELHCQLVLTRHALELGVYDERLREAGEVDAGLTWAKAGLAMYFEPSSKVIYEIPKRITEPEDIRYFAWKWDPRAILEGYRYFEKKWNLDISDQGTFNYFLAQHNMKAGILPRLFPSRWAIGIDSIFIYMRDACVAPSKVWRRLKERWLGLDEWRHLYRNLR